MTPLARRNMFHDKIRLAVTLTGMTFAVVLIIVELGLFLGFSTTTSSLIDRSRADLWLASRNVPYIEQGSPFSERKLYQVRATPGAASAEKYIARFASWKRPDGGNESVQVRITPAGHRWACGGIRARDGRPVEHHRRHCG